MNCGAGADLAEIDPMCNMSHMKTISLRELHNHTGKWVRAVEEEGAIVITDRGRPVARLDRSKAPSKMKISWRNRDYVPGYLAMLKAGKLSGGTDSSIIISEDRTSRDNSVAGLE
jgi:antitoxin (DNA-binding transcriptional repressor) of toxin-antitoxin stability system